VASYFSVGYDYEFRQLGVTDFLIWSGSEYLKISGFDTFDLMGLPQIDSERAKGIRHFKTAWASDNGQIRSTYTISRGKFGLNSLYFKNIVNGFKKTLALFRKRHGEKE
jgi:lipid II:glycine glycyltransferase (peptidoglycan interpeptide bridge formation enzyme)